MGDATQPLMVPYHPNVAFFTRLLFLEISIYDAPPTDGSDVGIDYAEGYQLLHTLVLLRWFLSYSMFPNVDERPQLPGDKIVGV